MFLGAARHGGQPFEGGNRSIQLQTGNRYPGLIGNYRAPPGSGSRASGVRPGEQFPGSRFDAPVEAQAFGAKLSA
jgi:hypothetical protein